MGQTPNVLLGLKQFGGVLHFLELAFFLGKLFTHGRDFFFLLPLDEARDAVGQQEAQRGDLVEAWVESRAARGGGNVRHVRSYASPGEFIPCRVGSGGRPMRMSSAIHVPRPDPVEWVVLSRLQFGGGRQLRWLGFDPVSTPTGASSCGLTG